MTMKCGVLAATLAAALALSAVPAAQAGTAAAPPSVDNVLTAASETTTISGTFRKAVAEPAPSETTLAPSSLPRRPVQAPREWAVIELDSGQQVSVDPSSVGLREVLPGDEVVATVTLDADAQQQLSAEGIEINELARTPAETVEAALAEIEPLNVAAGRVTEKAATSKNVKHQAWVLAAQDSDWNDNFSLEDAKKLTEDAAAYWKAESLGSITSFTIAGQKTWEVNDSCHALFDDPFDFWDTAAEEFPGLDIYAPGKHLIVYLPQDCIEAYGSTGLAMIGSSITSGGPLSILEDDLLTAVHELGHNFSLGHANLEWPDAKVKKDGEYMAVYGPMSLSTGFGPGALDIGFQHQLKLDTSTSLRSISALGSSSATLVPVSATSGLRGLTFIDPNSKVRYYIEYRSGTGKDADAFYHQGHFFFSAPEVVYSEGIRIYRITQSRSKVLTNVMATADGEYYPALYPDQVYSDRSGSFKVTVGAMTTKSADVKVTFKAVKTKTKLSVSKARFGKGATVKVATSGSPTPKGKVVIYDGKKKLKTLTLKSGKTSYKLPANLKVGKHKITAKYLPSAGYASSSASKTISVYKATPKAKVTMKVLKAKKLQRGTRAEVTVKLDTVAKAAPTGKVTVKVGKKTVSKAAKLKRVKGTWRATITTNKLPKGKVSVVYSGNKTFSKTTYATKYRVK